MMVRVLLPKAVLAGAVLLAATPALADVKAGVDAWSRGDYATAVHEWQGPAARGDADAEFNLGQAYKLGRGVKRDLAKAEELFGEAAAKGHLEAADNYGLLLFQRGEHARAMPYIKAAANRGDRRAQYLLGIAYFNGDNVPKDWVRAYALESLAQQAGLPQAVSALAQMDKYIPLEQRQQSAALATKLAADTAATRAREVAAADLGSQAPRPGGAGPIAQGTAGSPPSPGPIDRSGGAATAGADYARPHTQAVASLPRPIAPSPSPAPAHVVPATRPTPRPAPHHAAPPPARTTAGAWRVQLGAFGVAGNAEALWKRVKNRPELSGHGELLEPAGKLTKLQVGGFASRTEADTACSRLKAGGFSCLVVEK